MNSPLEQRKVRLRGLQGRIFAIRDALSKCETAAREGGASVVVAAGRGFTRPERGGGNAPNLTSPHIRRRASDLPSRGPPTRIEPHLRTSADAHPISPSRGPTMCIESTLRAIRRRASKPHLRAVHRRASNLTCARSDDAHRIPTSREPQMRTKSHPAAHPPTHTESTSTARSSTARGPSARGRPARRGRRARGRGGRRGIAGPSPRPRARRARAGAAARGGSAPRG